MTGTHRRKEPGRVPGSFIAGTVSVVMGLGVGVAAIAELLRYSPYEDPGAGSAGGLLALAAVLLIIVPPLYLAISVGSKAAHDYSAFKKTLTPAERMTLNLAETAMVTGVHLAAREHHKKVDERLTASVMGEPRTGRDGITTVA